MDRTLIDREGVQNFFAVVDEHFGEDGTIFLTGETTQLVEGWRPWGAHIEFCSAVKSGSRERFNAAIREAAQGVDVPIIDEYPGEVIPLPDGHEGRTVELSEGFDLPRLRVVHFDPFSVCYRYIARGMEPDYHLVLAYLESGWLTKEELDARLDGLLPKFSFATIAQDPAEFRRRYIGLTQMYNSIRAGQTHRPTPV